MTMKKSLLMGMTLIAAAVVNVHAAEFGRPITANIVVNNEAIQGGAPQVKQVYLMNIKLTPAQKQKFIDNHSSNLNALTASDTALPKKFDQGMNGIPVLDQGRHGTCVTFATTAAVDALLGKGDYISQLCGLELGSYLEKRSYYPSGWDGSTGPYILDQMMQFGVISKDTQKNKTCAGVSEYPGSSESNTGNAISLDDYKALSESIEEKMYWEPLMTFPQRLQWDGAAQVTQSQKVLNSVKQTLSTKDKAGNMARVTFATILPVSHCSVGACAKFHAANDTWAYTNEIKKDSNPELGGHEMVIVGYDDNAVAKDNEGKTHKGLLTLRNSWGSSAGDHGNYYMTYEFFKQYVMEVQKLGIAPEDNI